MSASSFTAEAVVLPNPQVDNSQTARIVNASIGYNLEADNFIRTLSFNNPNNFDVIQGLLYVPDASVIPNACSPSDLSHIPHNVTRLESFPPADYPFVAFAPWTSISCVQAYLSLMRAEAVRGAIFYHPTDLTTEPPPSSDHSWFLNDSGAWTNDQFPIYALPGATGAALMASLARYSGNMSSAPHGAQLIQEYDPRDTVRLFARMDVSGAGGIPSLWVFLIIVLAILLAIVLFTSVVMHIIQRRQRTVLSRRVANGEVDLEALGIKRLNVPQEILDKMPQYTFTSKVEGVAPVPGARQVPFTQPTCPICLDDFVHGETSVRELPCNHIFHAECIDPFLRDNSSLCPMCKKSALPAGYCPVHVTNLMVRRERLIRRMRQRAAAENGSGPLGRRATIMSAVSSRVRRLSQPSTAVLGSSSSQGNHGTINYGASSEMQNLDVSARRGTASDITPTLGQNMDGAGTEGQGAAAVPAEVRAQGPSARRAWQRQRLARLQEMEYTEAAAEARAVDERRPPWRRIAGRLNSRWE